MSVHRYSPARLKRVFQEGFSIGDIAEPLVSFDGIAPATEVRAFMDQQRYAVVGIRIAGTVSGYAIREELDGGLCEDHLHQFEPTDVVSDSTTIPDIVLKLDESPRVFVTAFGQVGGIITRTDLQKPPVRMWLFGVITIIEMGLTKFIQDRFPDGEWKRFISEARLQKAEALLEERKRRRQELDLLACLQLSDKGQIVLRNEDLREAAGFQSRNKGEATMRELEGLRNNLAHAHDIITCDWQIIFKMATSLDTVFDRHP